jgi:LTXXQ motif family protein
MHKTVRMAAIVAALAMMSVPSFAQGNGGGRGQGGFGGGGFGFGGQFGRGGEITVTQVPLAALTSALKLTSEQTAKIKTIQDKLEEQRKAARPNFGANGGARPSPEEMQQIQEEMRARQEQLRSDDAKAGKAIEAMLTPDQSAALKAAMPGWKACAAFGLLEVADQLKLTPEQIAVLEKAAKERQSRMQGGRRGGGN